MTTRSAAWLGGLVLLGLSLRLLPLANSWNNPNLHMQPDSWGYHRLACNLLAGNGYSWEEQPPYTPNLYRPPAYPATLAGLYAVGGPHFRLAIVAQILAGALAILGTYALARLLVGPGPLALIAAAVQAVDPIAIVYNNLLLTETFTSLVALLVLLRLIQFVQTQGQRSLWPAGLLLGAGILVHPVLLVAPLFLLAAPLLSRPLRTRGHLAAAALAASLAWLPAGLWVARNATVGDYASISSVAAVNMLKYKAAGVMAEVNGTSRDAERDRLTAECEAMLAPDASRADRYRLWSRRGTEVLLAHPLVYARLHLQGAVFELIGPERGLVTVFLYARWLPVEAPHTEARLAALRQGTPNRIGELIRWAILGLQGGLLGLTLLGLGGLIARRRYGLLVVLLLLPAIVLILSGGPEASPRFRVIYLPMLSLMAAVGAQIAWGWLTGLVTVMQPRPVPAGV